MQTITGRLTDTLAGIRGEIRAGWLDARRTARAVPWHGRRWGDLSYATGYAAGALRGAL